MTPHLRGTLYESVAVFTERHAQALAGSASGVKFYKYECSCGWLGLDENDLGLARDAYRRHVEREAAKEAA